MALVSRMVSDISGMEAPEREFVTLVVRGHPAAVGAKALDVLPEEIAGLRETPGVLTLEIKGKNRESRRITVLLADFREVVPDEVVRKARGTRGRRPGYSPRSSSAR